jgi:hypothetical protein
MNPARFAPCSVIDLLHRDLSRLAPRRGEYPNADGIVAKMVNGVLEVTIPKQPEVKARRITIDVG